MGRCTLDRPFREGITSWDTYRFSGTQIVITMSINTLAAILLGKNKIQGALLGASASLLLNAIHFTSHHFDKNSSSFKFIVKISQLSGLIIAAAHAYYGKSPYLTWSNLSLTITTPIVAVIYAEWLRWNKKNLQAP